MLKNLMGIQYLAGVKHMENDKVIEKIIHIKLCFQDSESDCVDIDDLTEFIIDSLNENFQKDYITFEEVKSE